MDLGSWEKIPASDQEILMKRFRALRNRMLAQVNFTIERQTAKWSEKDKALFFTFMQCAPLGQHTAQAFNDPTKRVLF